MQANSLLDWGSKGGGDDAGAEDDSRKAEKAHVGERGLNERRVVCEGTEIERQESVQTCCEGNLILIRNSRK